MDDNTITPDEVQDRIERARSETMHSDIIEYDPLIVEVDNEDGTEGTTHTVVVDSLYCSCSDYRYRHSFCKHLCYLLEDGGLLVSDELRDTVKEKLDVAIDVRSELENELERTNSRIESYELLMDQSDVELFPEVYTESNDDDNDVEDDTDDSNFEDMIIDAL